MQLVHYHTFLDCKGLTINIYTYIRINIYISIWICLDLTLCVFHMRPVLFHGFLQYLVWKISGVEEHNAPWNHQCAASTQQLPMPWGWHAISRKNARMCMPTSSKGSRPNRKIGKTHTTDQKNFNTLLGIGIKSTMRNFRFTEMALTCVSRWDFKQLAEWKVVSQTGRFCWDTFRQFTPKIHRPHKWRWWKNCGRSNFIRLQRAVLHAFHSELLILCPCCAGAKSGNIAPKSTHRPIKSWWPGN